MIYLDWETFDIVNQETKLINGNQWVINFKWKLNNEIMGLIGN